MGARAELPEDTPEDSFYKRMHNLELYKRMHYCYKFLPYGIASAPDLFQWKMESILQGIQGSLPGQHPGFRVPGTLAGKFVLKMVP